MNKNKLVISLFVIITMLCGSVNLANQSNEPARVDIAATQSYSVRDDVPPKASRSRRVQPKPTVASVAPPAPAHTHSKPAHKHFKSVKKAPKPTPVKPKFLTGTSVWDRLALCESGGNWATNTGNGYYGGLQFSLSSWRAVGGTGYPHNASRSEQINRGNSLRSSQGWGAWPACSRKLGL